MSAPKVLDFNIARVLYPDIGRLKLGITGTGAQGYQGIQGSQGIAGSIGVQGYQGYQGIAGIGATGDFDGGHAATIYGGIDPIDGGTS